MANRTGIWKQRKPLKISMPGSQERVFSASHMTRVMTQNRVHGHRIRILSTNMSVVELYVTMLLTRILVGAVWRFNIRLSFIGDIYSTIVPEYPTPCMFLYCTLAVVWRIVFVSVSALSTRKEDLWIEAFIDDFSLTLRHILPWQWALKATHTNIL